MSSVQSVGIALIALFVAAMLIYSLLRFCGRARVAPPLMAVFRAAGASERIAGYLARGQTRKAIQAYQTENTVPLCDAQQAVEQMRLAASSPETLLAAGIPAEVVTQMGRGETIAAIKAYRTEKQVSLREAKATVDQLRNLQDFRREV